jgi:hypothetical protein
MEHCLVPGSEQATAEATAQALAFAMDSPKAGGAGLTDFW